MTTDQHITLAPTILSLPPDPPIRSLMVILPDGSELYHGWRQRWLELGRHRRGPGTLQRDLDGSHTIMGLTSWQVAHIRGESR